MVSPSGHDVLTVPYKQEVIVPRKAPPQINITFSVCYFLCRNATLTALRWLEGFAQAVKRGPSFNRPLFVPALSIEGQIKNRAVLDCFARFVWPLG